jgi:butyrate kinase
VNDDDIRIFVINPGSTSTKLALYNNSHPKIEADYPTIDKADDNIDTRLALRRKILARFFEENSIDATSLQVIASRGGGGGNFYAGAYHIDKELVEHCFSYKTPHASSLGPVLAYELSEQLGIPAYVYDAEGVNEFYRFATLSGMAAFPVTPGSHTLNAKAAARLASAELGGKYNDFNLIVCHMGGGISTSLHKKGRLVDSTSDAYSPERSGGMPMMAMVNFTNACFSGEYTLSQLLHMQIGGGGLAGYLGTSDLQEVERRMNGGDSDAEFYYNGMIYQLAKDIGGMAAANSFNIDAIVLTGGMAYSQLLVKLLTEKIEKIAPVIVKAGSHEMQALACGALSAFLGKEPIHLFSENKTK